MAWTKGLFGVDAQKIIVSRGTSQDGWVRLKTIVNFISSGGLSAAVYLDLYSEGVRASACLAEVDFDSWDDLQAFHGRLARLLRLDGKTKVMNG